MSSAAAEAELLPVTLTSLSSLTSMLQLLRDNTQIHLSAIFELRDNRKEARLLL